MKNVDQTLVNRIVRTMQSDKKVTLKFVHDFFRKQGRNLNEETVFAIIQGCREAEKVAIPRILRG